MRRRRLVTRFPADGSPSSASTEMKPRTGNPLLADVAARAGVSTMTVSRVVNHHPNVSDATRQRVQESIDALGYRANVAARTLAGGRSRVLGTISVQPESWGPSNTVYGIEAAARESDHLISFMTVREPTIDRMRDSIEELRNAHVEGIIVVVRLRSAVEALRDLMPRFPLVITSSTTIVPNTVGIDQELGARIATRHLLELGHETVHHVRGPKGWLDGDERASGWRKELRSQRRPIGRCLSGDWGPASGYEAGKVLARDPKVTAVFASNDPMALGVMLAMSEAGRDVPGDVSVVGVDDVPESGYFNPPLTTVRQDFEALGRLSVDRLLTVIEGGERGRIALEPDLVVRQSTARFDARSRPRSARRSTRL